MKPRNKKYKYNQRRRKTPKHNQKMMTPTLFPRSEIELSELEVEGLMDSHRPPSSYRYKTSRSTSKLVIVIVLCLLLIILIVVDKGAMTSKISNVEGNAVDPPTVIKVTDAPTAIKATDAPTAKKATDAPTAIKATNAPTAMKATNTPTTMKATNTPTAMKANNTSTDRKVTNAPTAMKANNNDNKDAMIEKWGKWHFWDNDPGSRPTEDYLSAYPNKDCPYEDFPWTAWQADSVYVNHFLDSASELMQRGKNALYEEYGLGPVEDLDDEQLLSRVNMFKLNLIDFEAGEINKPPEGSLDRGGWTTRKSLKALSRRLIHAMMTNDSFTVVMGGDSAAAGHGNHFLQSYMMQFHNIMEPIFERIGVKLITRNIANEGLGTIQNAMGSGSIYGDEVDMVVWDSSMTEESDAEVDLFFRQALIGGKRPPVLWGGNFEPLKTLHLQADADIMAYGSGMASIPLTENMDQVENLPWAARYLKCPEDNTSLCDDENNKFRTTCWVERSDVTPPMEQASHAPYPKLHPGFRTHQLKSRILAFTVIDALEDAIDTWSEETIISGHPLPDEFWHITNHYENIRDKTRNLDESIGKCTTLSKYFPKRVCKTPLKGRTEFTPRANPEETSITSILKAAPNHNVPKLETQMVYSSPDVDNPSLTLPDDEVDVRAILSNRRSLLLSGTDMHRKLTENIFSHQDDYFSDKLDSYVRRRAENDELIAGHGWEVTGSQPGNCDGTSTGICGRKPDSDCLLYGHMDGRGGLLGNGFSGWLILNLSNITEGLIILKLETEHLSDESTLTKDWTEENNGERLRDLEADPLPEDLIFDYAIDGKITSLTKGEFEARKTQPQKAVELLTILDDLDVGSGGAHDMEFAIRLRNCGRACTFRLTHVYWA